MVEVRFRFKGLVGVVRKMIWVVLYINESWKSKRETPKYICRCRFNVLQLLNFVNKIKPGAENKASHIPGSCTCAN